jgi:hypothetical protein
MEATEWKYSWMITGMDRSDATAAAPSSAENFYFPTDFNLLEQK